MLISLMRVLLMSMLVWTTLASTALKPNPAPKEKGATTPSAPSVKIALNELSEAQRAAESNYNPGLAQVVVDVYSL